MAQALLFDLDGLLIDSESLHFDCWRETLATIGVALDEECYLNHWTRAGLGIVDFCQQREIAHDVDSLRWHKSKLYEQRVRTTLKLMPDARECLNRFRGRKRLALATAGYIDAVNPALEAMGLRDYFEVIVTRNDVKRFKPAPDVFLLAAERLNLPPNQCVVLEDAEKGVRAAHAAGMACIAIPNRHTADNDFSLASIVLTSLNEVTPEMVDRLRASSPLPPGEG